MSIPEDSPRFLAALNDFKRARRRGALERALSQLRGRADQLLSYEDVRQQLHTGPAVNRGLQQIPLDAIVGSVGRYADFTRSFLPRRENAQQRWARVRAAFNHVDQIPPISVYQVGDSFFVLDGNHRVSVARMLGADHIAAYVTQVETRVPLTPDVDADTLICQAKYADFLEETSLDQLRPAADLTVTAPGQYRVLRQQIQQYQEWRDSQQEAPVSQKEVVAGWYDEIYLPVVDVIRRRRLLEHFPDRTETDLYVWMVRYQEELAEEVGWEVAPDQAASSLVYEHSSEPRQRLERMRDRVLETLIPDSLAPGPPPGLWRERQVSDRSRHFLFTHILVPIGGEENGWRAWEQALVVARREQAEIHGLHVLDQEDALLDQKRAQSIQRDFAERLKEAGQEGDLVLERGTVARAIWQRARWNDLVVIGLQHLPGSQPGKRLSSGISNIIRRCGRPVLAVPGAPSLLERPLLAYDGSPKAREALFVAAYLAAKWELPLVVISAGETETKALAVLEEARFYLIARGVSATYLAETGPVAEAIRTATQAHGSDLVVMGGYGFQPLVEVVVGSTVDHILRWRACPVLICR